MTDEEHMARAMLMGRVYDWRDHTYSFMSSDNSYPIIDGALDADTLRPVGVNQSNLRLQKKYGSTANAPNWEPI